MPLSPAVTFVNDAMWTGSKSIYFDGSAQNNDVNGTYPAHMFVTETAPNGYPTFSGDFCWEGYVKFATGSLGADRGIYTNGNGSGHDVIYLTASNRIVYRVGGTTRISGATAIAADTVYKWSVTRASGVITLRIQGVSQGTYSTAENIAFGTSMYWGGTTNLLIGHMDELAGYFAAKYTADYTPAFADIPETLAGDPFRDSLAYMFHCDPAIHSTGGLFDPLSNLQCFAPTWPVTGRLDDPNIVVRRHDYGGKGRIAGTVSIAGTPDVPVSRRVRLYRESDGVCLQEVRSDPATGAYAFTYYDPGQTYTVVAYDGPRVFRAAIADGVVPELMP